MPENTLKTKADTVNQWIEKVENWVIILEGKEYLPKHPDAAALYGFVYDNLVVGARVEMYGFGKIYKRVILASNEYDMMEIPVEMWHKTWDAFYNPVGQDAASPLDPVVKDNQVITVARWWPPEDYVKQLIEKRNFMTTKEFAVWAKVIDDSHKLVGGKTPSYIDPKPFISVSKEIH